MEGISLKELYGLSYDQSGFKSGLITWYNKLVDKSVQDLDFFDVARMIRQNILRAVAIDRAIDLFDANPFDGMIQDGDLLSLLVSLGDEVAKSSKACALAAYLENIDDRIVSFDWDEESSKEEYVKNLAQLKAVLSVG